VNVGGEQGPPQDRVGGGSAGAKVGPDPMKPMTQYRQKPPDRVDFFSSLLFHDDSVTRPRDRHAPVEGERGRACQVTARKPHSTKRENRSQECEPLGF
jgi:hypothetical protein